MRIIINSTSMIPIYEQIMESVKQQIADGTLTPGAPLPSVRVLAKDLKISALTVKKAYDRLEEEGFTATVHGKGTWVTGENKALLREQQRREIESEMEAAVKKAHLYGLTDDEIRQILDLMLGE